MGCADTETTDITNKQIEFLTKYKCGLHILGTYGTVLIGQYICG